MSDGEENHDTPILRIWKEGLWPCFSPDGQHLLFTGHLDRRNCCLMLMSVEADEPPQVITPPDINAKRPAWLTGTREIAFNRDQSGLCTINLDSGNIEPFLPDMVADISYLHPCAYPDERAVVVVSQYKTYTGVAAVLYKLAPEADQPVRQLTSFPEVCAGRAGVSPDGESVVFAGNAGHFHQGANQLWVIGPDERPRRLEHGEPELAQGRAPRWSPDGKWICCTSTRPSRNPTESTPKAVWIISADGSESHCLTDRVFNTQQVAWSPDQKKLACGGGLGIGLLELPARFQMSSTVAGDEHGGENDQTP
jgi:Tol biopolymer transport system component